MVSAISCGWFADFGKKTYHYTMVIQTGLFWQMVTNPVSESSPLFISTQSGKHFDN